MWGQTRPIQGRLAQMRPHGSGAGGEANSWAMFSKASRRQDAAVSQYIWLMKVEASYKATTDILRKNVEKM